MGRVGGWGGLNITRHTIFSNTVSYTKLDFPTKFYQNRAKIAKVCRLGGFWVDGLGGFNMAHFSCIPLLVTSIQNFIEIGQKL